MLQELLSSIFRINGTTEEYFTLQDRKERRVYLSQEINRLEYEDSPNEYMSRVGHIVKFIFDCNREDKGKAIEDRKPIKLYINSPGGDVTEGFSLVSAITISKTPVYTINIGQWSSMSFYVGISGHKRFSLPDMMFLLHDGSTGAIGSVNKVQDRIEFDKRFEREVIKRFVLEHSKMSNQEYDAYSRVELYMLPPDALKYGFIDEIVTNLDDIL